MNNFAKKKKKHKKCKHCNSWVGHWMSSCPSCNHSCDHDHPSNSTPPSDSGEDSGSDTGGDSGGMSSAAWIRSNCKFAMELPPSTPAPIPPAPMPTPAPAPQPQPMQPAQPTTLDPNDPRSDPRWTDMENMFVNSLDSFKKIAENDDSSVEAIEEDRFDPGSSYGHYTETTGAYNQHAVDLVIKGRVYFPDLLLKDPAYAEYGGVAENVVFGFKEAPPKVVEDVIGGWDELQTDYKVLTMQRDGDFYEMTIECSLSGQTEYDDGSDDDRYDDRDDF